MITKIIQRYSPEQCVKLRNFALDIGADIRTIAKMGLNGFTPEKIREFIKATGVSMPVGDSASAPDMISLPSIANAVQFFQHWIPEVVEVVCAPTDADEIIGNTVAGTWADAEIVQPIVERTGQPKPYSDKSNTPYSNYNVNFEKRSIIRFEDGFEVGVLEEERSAKMRIGSNSFKRSGVAMALEIERNIVAYNGYTDGTNLTYGLLNDPNLPAYVTASVNSAGTSTAWEDKTFLEIQSDVLGMIKALQVNTKKVYNPKRDKATLVVSLASDVWANKTNEYGKSLATWLKETFPLIDFKSSAYLDGANGGANVAYLFPETFGPMKFKVIEQYTQDKLRLLGVWNKGKNYEEQYSNATAGVMVRVPVAVYRLTGV